MTLAEQLIDQYLDESDMDKLAKKFKSSDYDWDEDEEAGEFTFKSPNDAKAFARAAKKELGYDVDVTGKTALVG